jgi:CDP-paratose 2-epimerase
MKVLITGICGFVGSALASELKQGSENIEVIGLDNLSRSGSEVNRALLKKNGVRFVHGDLRNPSDLENLPKVDWVIEAAANPSVLAGVSATSSSRQLMEHNLFGTVNALEYCKRHRAGMILLSTSRVYSLAALSGLPMETKNDAFVPRFSAVTQAGISADGVTEEFSTQPPLSLYGSAKLASEVVALDYGSAFDFPVHINRCGVLAGAGQFGKADQGIFSFWLHSWRAKQPLKYIGFGGHGFQLRDCLHPRDLCALLVKQMKAPEKSSRVLNVSGGAESGISLANLSKWCERRFGPHTVSADAANRQFDIPWLVLDSSRAREEWNWRPNIHLEMILAEIADHADKNPDWLELSNAS